MDKSTRRILVLFVLLSFGSVGQKIKKYALSDSLSEISGLEILNDSTLVAINDGGDKAQVYLLDFKGKILKTVNIENAKNVDWEDLARDKKYLYIGDVGNNENKRENLAIYRVSIKDLLAKDEVKAEKIEISYGEQKHFPPDKDEWFYDAEAITVYKDTIYLFTKNRSKPSSGTTLVYKFPTKPGEYRVKASHEIFIGKGGFWKDGITSVDVMGKDFYLMTYNRIIVQKYENGVFTPKEEIDFMRLTQKESIVLLSKNEFFVADEYQVMLGGRKLYKVKMK